MPRRPFAMLVCGLLLSLVAGGLPATGVISPADEQAGPSDVVRADAQLHPVASPSSTLAAVGSAARPDGSRTLSAATGVTPGVTVVGLRWTGTGPEAEEAVASLRVRSEGSWSEWGSLGGVLPAGTETDNTGEWGTEGALVLDADQIEVELTGAVGEATLALWTTSVTEADRRVSQGLAPATADQDRLRVATRNEWGADENWRRVSPLLHETPKLGVTVHHTAGANGYAPESVPAILRGIYYYHAITLDWGDIGYNLLVDQQGRVWEGRAGGLERNVRGAHSTGMNIDWFGISILGNHEVTPVPQTALSALAAGSAWALNANGADVNDVIDYTNVTLGWTRPVPALHGHNAVGVTLCPGIFLLGVFEQLRSQVALEQDRDRLAVQRVAGSDRYRTAAQLAREANLHGTRTAYLTRGEGEDLVDALPAGTIAHLTGSALLLTRHGQLPGPTDGALLDLGVREVVVVGGPGVLAQEGRRMLEARGVTVRELGDEDRYRTAVALSREVHQSRGGTVYLASGEVLADALGGASAAAAHESGLLLTEPGTLTQVTRERLHELQPRRVVLLGGPEAISEQVEQSLQAELPLAVVDRIGGRDRYRTSALLAADAFDTAPSAVVASGTSLVDSMTSTQLAGSRQAPTLLTRKHCTPASVRAAVADLDVHLLRLAGGESVLAEDGTRTC